MKRRCQNRSTSSGVSFSISESYKNWTETNLNNWLYDAADLMTSGDFILSSTWWPTQSQSRLLNHKTTQPIYSYHQDAAKQVDLMGNPPMAFAMFGRGGGTVSDITPLEHETPQVWLDRRRLVVAMDSIIKIKLPSIWWYSCFLLKMNWLIRWNRSTSAAQIKLDWIQLCIEEID